MTSSEMAKWLKALHEVEPSRCAEAMVETAVSLPDQEFAALLSAVQLLLEALLAPAESRALEKLLMGAAGERLVSNCTPPGVATLEAEMTRLEEELAGRLAGSAELADLESRERSLLEASAQLEGELRELETRLARLQREEAE